ncbi:hypothetical protein HDU76_001700 [Blyttiomyces sp. JEL0837]|nr:hypothetical protein HDU76_001700 [Blyttiomyces sp. JEL0837]
MYHHQTPIYHLELSNSTNEVIGGSDTKVIEYEDDEKGHVVGIESGYDDGDEGIGGNDNVNSYSEIELDSSSDASDNDVESNVIYNNEETSSSSIVMSVSGWRLNSGGDNGNAGGDDINTVERNQRQGESVSSGLRMGSLFGGGGQGQGQGIGISGTASSMRWRGLRSAWMDRIRVRESRIPIASDQFEPVNVNRGAGGHAGPFTKDSALDQGTTPKSNTVNHDNGNGNGGENSGTKNNPLTDAEWSLVGAWEKYSSLMGASVVSAAGSVPGLIGLSGSVRELERYVERLEDKVSNINNRLRMTDMSFGQREMELSQVRGLLEEVKVAVADARRKREMVRRVEVQGEGSHGMARSQLPILRASFAEELGRRGSGGGGEVADGDGEDKIRAGDVKKNVTTRVVDGSKKAHEEVGRRGGSLKIDIGEIRDGKHASRDDVGVDIRRDKKGSRFSFDLAMLSKGMLSSLAEGDEDDDNGVDHGAGHNRRLRRGSMDSSNSRRRDSWIESAMSSDDMDLMEAPMFKW